jgi:hypothetical protein
MSPEFEDKNREQETEWPGPDLPDDQDHDSDRDSLELALRFLVGLLAIGGEEATHRLQEMQQKLDADPTRWQAGSSTEDNSLSRRAWHLGIGLLWRGQRRVRQELRRGLALTLGVADRAATMANPWRGSRMPTPIRDALATRLIQWREDAAEIVQEGAVEEQKGRALASGTLTELISELMDEIAKNPELQEFVQDMVSQQGMGMATSAMENARSAALTADDAAEGLLRRILRRTPRGELPPSPVEGQPQTMYAPKIQVEEETLDDD